MELTQKKRFKAGELIFSHGDSGDCAYIIETGRVEVFMSSKSEKVVLTILGVGEILGEMSVIDGSPRSASAAAVEPCEVVVVSREALFERFEAADPIVRLLISMLLRRIRFSNESKAQFGGLLKDELIPGNVLKKQKEEVLERLKMEAELKEALTGNQFNMHFQPIVNINDGCVAGFEALIRWKSKSRGMVSPDIFIGIAEETSLIVPIGRWVIEKSCEQLAVFQKELSNSNVTDELFMSINVSSRQFRDTDFFTHLTGVVKKLNIKPSLIKLEVTERILMEDAVSLHAIKKARELGFHIALDDFGTGHSSLGYLIQFEVDSIKIDRSFVRKIQTDQKAFIITRAIVSMSNDLNIPVIAEGIETSEDHDLLNTISCKYGQGYLYSKPMPSDVALNYLIKNLTEIL
ncbi:MAG: EAL domain-containing protein [Oligoflexales bacterium]|nr:EAL domain-containing protein [Oligoflexales bacterium]